MTQKQLMETMSDLAEEEGLSLDEFVLSVIKKKNDSLLSGAEGMPEELKEQFFSAIEAKNQAKEIKRAAANEKAMRDDIAAFRSRFPDTLPESIPDSVWKEVAEGIPLSHAYALYNAVNEGRKKNADSVNAENDGRSVPAVNDTLSAIPYTKEEVEKMTPQAVKSNYKKILSSIKNWKI